jgi:hypothetical protein
MPFNLPPLGHPSLPQPDDNAGHSTHNPPVPKPNPRAERIVLVMVVEIPSQSWRVVLSLN